MRRHPFVQKSQLLFKRPSTPTHALSRPGLSLKSQCLRSPLTYHRRQNRLLSTGAASPVDPNEQPISEPSSAEPPSEAPTSQTGPPLNEFLNMSTDNVEGPEKPTVRIRRTRNTTTKEIEAPEFPEGFMEEIIYGPTESYFKKDDIPHANLPDPELFEEALDKLLITLHPQNQFRAMPSPASSGHPIEPTLGLYCPLEGGDYVIDLAVHELAIQAGADIVTLDAIQLAAGEWGLFGKAANALNLPQNPLHFSAPYKTNTEAHRRKSRAQEEQEEEPPFILASPMSISLPKALSSMGGRMVVPSSRKPTAPSKLDLFFEALVNAESSNTVPKQGRPRIIYIRDFPTLAPSSSTWYPSLLYGVRQRRRGLLSRGTSVTSPVTIIFGMTPPIAPPGNSGSSSPRTSLMSLLMNRSDTSSQVSQDSKSGHTHDWSESEAAEVARDKRLRSRLMRWENNPNAFQNDFPKLQGKLEDVEKSSAMPEVVVLGGQDGSIAPLQSGAMSIDLSGPVSQEDQSSQFFRSAVLLPHTRGLHGEQVCRMNRRREINELAMRMAVGAIGGVIESTTAYNHEEMPVIPTIPYARTPTSPMLEDWQNRIEPWVNVRKVADRAIGSVIVQQRSEKSTEKPSLEPTVVSWDAVHSAWASTKHQRVSRRDWFKEALGDSHAAVANDNLAQNAPGSIKDKVVESIKNDPDLDTHEARLLPCIVDANSMTTSFSQVHLPSNTIDAVRTIVSLRMLYPHAFQHGILKEHGMTGCLLFGPPGTGKTLVVRALAKEAGCRMLAVSPSDVMDMYVGEGEKLVRAVFSLARKLSPCVVFLDEIDALFGARMSARESGSAHAHRGVITEFMQEMDGLKSSKEDNVIVIGATNRPFDLDDAVLRRLPRRLLVDLPGEKERAEILKILLRDEFLDNDVDVHALSRKTDGFSGSDLKHLCVSAALDSVKENMALPWDSRHSKAATAIAALPQPEEPTSSEPTPVLPHKETQAIELLQQTSQTIPPPREPAVTSASYDAQPNPEAIENTQSPIPTENPTPQLAENLDENLSIDPELHAYSEAMENRQSQTLTQNLEENITPGDVEQASDTVVPTTKPGAAVFEVQPASETADDLSSTAPQSAFTNLQDKVRVLHLRHFIQALKEITPSSSESLGSLAELRKWNEEFGEGRRDRKKWQVWGKGRFGFVNKPDTIIQEGRVAEPQ
ncbi:hypothetical protein CPB83DRAFT_847511 [Crepidotus variabilis]|uniref:AAA+ ATPase domain-containing protein n=1 Tax=Crepidotus variabilis TaxID=179855 RepID=A0A9P6JTX9_9AGAR|nr:hypothetical protein CPB83DRAFT_847511 [Crepidotus variabilis]